MADAVYVVRAGRRGALEAAIRDAAELVAAHEPHLGRQRADAGPGLPA